MKIIYTAKALYLYAHYSVKRTKLFKWLGEIVILFSVFMFSRAMLPNQEFKSMLISVSVVFFLVGCYFLNKGND
jgi:hypothetical protein